MPPAPVKTDPITGEQWMRLPKLYEKSWFGVLLLGLAWGLGYLCWRDVGQLQAPSEAGLHWFALGRSIISGQGFTVPGPGGTPLVDVTTSPLYALLVGLVMAVGRSVNPVQVLPWLAVVQGVLYAFLIALVYRWVYQWLKAPYPGLIALVVAVAPATVHCLIDLSPLLLYGVLSILALLQMDNAFEKANQGKLPDAKALLACALLSLLAAMTHPLGWCLVLTFLAVVFRWMGYQRALSWGVVFLLAITPWSLRAVYHEGVAHSPLVASAFKPSLQLDPLTPDRRWQQSANQTLALLSVAATGTDTTEIAPPAEPPTQAETAAPKRFSKAGVLQFLASWQWASWLVGFALLMGLFNGLFHRSGAVPVYVSLTLLALAVLGHNGWGPGLWAGLTPVFPLILLLLFWTLRLVGVWGLTMRLPILTAVMPFLFGVLLVHSAWAHLSHYHTGPTGNRWQWQAVVNPQALPPQADPSAQAFLATEAIPSKAEALDSQGLLQNPFQTQAALTPVTPLAKELSRSKSKPTSALPAGLPVAKNLKGWEPVNLAPVPLTESAPQAAKKPSATTVSTKPPAPVKPSGASPALAPPPVPSASLKPPDTNRLANNNNQAYGPMLPWLKTHVGQQELVMSPSPTRFNAYANRPVLAYPPPGPPELMVQQALKADYILEEAASDEAKTVVAPLVSHYGNRFKLAYQDSTYRLWEVQR